MLHFPSGSTLASALARRDRLLVVPAEARAFLLNGANGVADAKSHAPDNQYLWINNIYQESLPKTLCRYLICYGLVGSFCTFAGSFLYLATNEGNSAFDIWMRWCCVAINGLENLVFGGESANALYETIVALYSQCSGWSSLFVSFILAAVATLPPVFAYMAEPTSALFETVLTFVGNYSQNVCGLMGLIAFFVTLYQSNDQDRYKRDFLREHLRTYVDSKPSISGRIMIADEKSFGQKFAEKFLGGLLAAVLVVGLTGYVCNSGVFLGGLLWGYLVNSPIMMLGIKSSFGIASEIVSAMVNCKDYCRLVADWTAWEKAINIATYICAPIVMTLAAFSGGTTLHLVAKDCVAYGLNSAAIGMFGLVGTAGFNAIVVLLALFQLSNFIKSYLASKQAVGSAKYESYKAWAVESAINNGNSDAIINADDTLFYQWERYKTSRAVPEVRSCCSRLFSSSSRPAAADGAQMTEVRSHGTAGPEEVAYGPLNEPPVGLSSAAAEMSAVKVTVAA